MSLDVSSICSLARNNDNDKKEMNNNETGYQ